MTWEIVGLEMQVNILGFFLELLAGILDTSVHTCYNVDATFSNNNAF